MGANGEGLRRKFIKQPTSNGEIKEMFGNIYEKTEINHLSNTPGDYRDVPLGQRLKFLEDRTNIRHKDLEVVNTKVSVLQADVHRLTEAVKKSNDTIEIFKRLLKFEKKEGDRYNFLSLFYSGATSYDTSATYSIDLGSHKVTTRENPVETNTTDFKTELKPVAVSAPLKAVKKTKKKGRR